MTDPNTAPRIDIQPLVDASLELLNGLVSDATNPELQKSIAALASDWLTIGALKAAGSDVAEPDMFADLLKTVQARQTALLQVPGLIAANKQDAFLKKLTAIGTTIITSAVSIAAAYATSGLSSLATAAVTSVASVNTVHNTGPFDDN